MVSNTYVLVPNFISNYGEVGSLGWILLIAPTFAGKDWGIPGTGSAQSVFR